MKSHLGIFFFLTLLLCVCTSTHASIVILKNGEQIITSHFEFDAENRVLIVSVNGKPEYFSITAIEKVIDDKGKDITESLVETSNPFVMRSKRKLPWNVTFTIAGNYVKPTGQYYEFVSSGPGFEGHLRIALNPRHALRIGFIKSGINYGNDVFLFLFDDMDFIVIPEPELSVFHYYIALNWYDLDKPIKPNEVRANIYAGIGGVSHTIKGDKWRVDANSEAIEFIGKVMEKETKFTFVGGFELEYSFSERVYLAFLSGLEGVWTKVYNVEDPTKTRHAIKGVNFRFSLGFTFAM
ncbi:MAG: hypothetical protein V3V99_03220 [candidate division Zixibacteria bacterium]